MKITHLLVSSFPLFAVLVLPASTWAESKSTSVKKGDDKTVPFKTSSNGETHDLTVNNGESAMDFATGGSNVVAQDDSDNVFWKRTSDTKSEKSSK